MISRRTFGIGAAMMAGDGLIRPMNAPPGASASVGVQPGSGQVVIAHYVIVTGSGGIFIYSGNPGPGNPPIAWMSGGTADPYGNALPSTTGIAGGGTFQAGDTIITPSGEYVYSSTPATGLLIASLAPAAGTDPFGDTTVEGVAAYVTQGGITYAVGLNAITAGGFPGVSIQDIASAPSLPAGVFGEASNAGSVAFASLFSGKINPSDAQSGITVHSQADSGVTRGKILLLAGELQLGNNSTLFVNDESGQEAITLSVALPSAPSAPATGVSLYANTNGNPAAVNPAGHAGAMPVVQSDAGTNTNANQASATALSAAYTIEANDLKAGTWYQIEMSYAATMEATHTLELGLSIDGSSSFTVNDTLSAAIVAAGIGVHGTIRVSLQCVTTGALGTINAFVDGTTGQTGAAATFANRGALTGAATGVSLDTTASHTISIISLWGGSTAGQTVSGTGSRCTRTGP